MPGDADQPRVRALTWNVHGFIGRARHPDPDSVIEAVHGIGADIVALQEIDERRRAGDDTPAFIRLSQEDGWYATEARTICTDDGDYGNALLSRWPISDPHRIDLSYRRREPRMAISCRVESPYGDIRVLTAHLGLSSRERRFQIGLIQRHLDEESEHAAIVLGDFNEWRRIGLTTELICPPFALVPSGPTFPSRLPLFRLDRIWCRPPLRPVAGGIVHECRSLSDHLPVIADLEFDAV